MDNHFSYPNTPNEMFYQRNETKQLKIENWKLSDILERYNINVNGQICQNKTLNKQITKFNVLVGMQPIDKS